MLAASLAAQSAPFGAADGWTISKLNGGCDMHLYEKRSKLTLSVLQIPNGKMQLTFVGDDWKFAAGEEQTSQSFDFKIKIPGI